MLNKYLTFAIFSKSLFRYFIASYLYKLKQLHSEGAVMRKVYRLKRFRKALKDYFTDEEDYPEEMIEDELENDEINSSEEGFWIGYTKA